MLNKVYPAIINESEWEPVINFLNKPGKPSDPEAIFASVTVTKNNSNILKKKLNLSFGSRIIDEINMEKDNRFHILRDKKNKYVLRLIPTESQAGYKLVLQNGSTVYRISFTLPDDMDLKVVKSVKVNFTLLSDRSIILNLNKFN